MAKFQTLTTTNVDKDVEQQKLYSLLVGMQRDRATLVFARTAITNGLDMPQAGGFNLFSYSSAG